MYSSASSCIYTHFVTLKTSLLYYNLCTDIKAQIMNILYLSFSGVLIHIHKKVITKKWAVHMMLQLLQCFIGYSSHRLLYLVTFT